jgi:hypothetical protein
VTALVVYTCKTCGLEYKRRRDTWASKDTCSARSCYVRHKTGQKTPNTAALDAARAAGAKSYIGICAKGHVGPRSTSNSSCNECRRLHRGLRNKPKHYRDERDTTYPGALKVERKGQFDEHGIRPPFKMELLPGLHPTARAWFLSPAPRL